MYDRKTWVVLALCGGLLAANFYFKPTPPAEPPAVIQEPSKPTDTSHAELTVEPQPPSTDEETVTLESSEVIFTLTNMGGGIKYADLKKQFKVGSDADFVRINQHGSGPIGGLAGAGENLENIAYAYKAEESVAGKKAVYIAKLPSGLIAKKTFVIAVVRRGVENLVIEVEGAVIRERTTP